MARMTTDYTPPTPAQVREFLLRHNLTGSVAAEMAGLNGSSAVRKYTGGSKPHSMGYATWFTLHAKAVLTPSELARIEDEMHNSMHD
jgi:hypothetical protein